MLDGQFPASIYLFKVNNGNARICYHGVFVVSFEDFKKLLFLLLTLNKYKIPGLAKHTQIKIKNSCSFNLGSTKKCFHNEITNSKQYPASNYIFKVDNRNTRRRCEICSKLIIKIPERRQWRFSGIFIVKFEHISYLVLVFLLSTLSKYKCRLGIHQQMNLIL